MAHTGDAESGWPANDAGRAICGHTHIDTLITRPTRLSMANSSSHWVVHTTWPPPPMMTHRWPGFMTHHHRRNDQCSTVHHRASPTPILGVSRNSILTVLEPCDLDLTHIRLWPRTAVDVDWPAHVTYDITGRLLDEIDQWTISACTHTHTQQAPANKVSKQSGHKASKGVYLVHRPRQLTVIKVL